MRYQSSHTGRAQEFDQDLANALADHVMAFNGDGASKSDLQKWLLSFEWEGTHLTINQLSPVFVWVCIAGKFTTSYALREGKELE